MIDNIEIASKLFDFLFMYGCVKFGMRKNIKKSLLKTGFEKERLGGLFTVAAIVFRQSVCDLVPSSAEHVEEREGKR